jgi:fatty aldehyde-generating acyl-ACP reductase
MHGKKHKDKIAIVIHPITRDLFYEYEPGLRGLSDSIAGKILEWTSPFMVSEVRGVVSSLTGEELKADMILCPIFMDQVATLSSKHLLGRVLKSIRLAESRSASMINLVAYTAMIASRNAVKLSAIVRTPLTTGINMTMALIPMAVLKAMYAMGYDETSMEALVYGANPIALYAIAQLARKLKKVYVYYHSPDRLAALRRQLPLMLQRKVVLLDRKPSYLLMNMDVIINATGKLPVGFDDLLLKSGAIVYDASYPRMINTSRSDVLIIDGMVLEPPGNSDFGCNFGLPKGFCFPCMAEAIALCFERRFESYSFEKNIETKKALDVYTLAMKHGFREGPLTSNECIVPMEKFAAVRKAVV